MFNCSNSQLGESYVSSSEKSMNVYRNSLNSDVAGTLRFMTKLSKSPNIKFKEAFCLREAVKQI